MLISRNVLFLIISVFLLFSCQPKDEYKQTVKFHNAEWNKDSIAHFMLDLQQNQTFYELKFSIEHGKRYEYRNIWLFVDVQSPQGTVQRDSLEYLLADEAGKWYGVKKSDNWTYDLIYKPRVAFPEKGKYVFSVQQAMRQAKISDISSFSLIINPILEHKSE